MSFALFQKQGETTMLFQPRNEKAQGLVEYALILVLVSITVIIILGLLGDEVGLVFDEITGVLNAR